MEWIWGRPRRNLPTINYAESDDEDPLQQDLEEGLNFESPLTSPNRPAQTRAGSPVIKPDDEVSDVLEKVNSRLNLHNDLEELASRLADVKTEEEDFEEVVVGHIEVAADADNLDDNDELANEEEEVAEEIAMAANYEDENGVDDPTSAMQDACRTIKGYQWDRNDLDFYFNQIEIKMQSCGVKKQWTKFQVLTTVLPKHVTDEVKKFLRRKETDYPQNNAYKLLKEEIIRIFGLPEDAGVQRALSRVLSGQPSQLARAMVNDVCDHELQGCCCHKWVLGLWKRQLPLHCQHAIAHHKFNKDTFDVVCKLADNVYESNRPQGAIAAVQVAATPALDDGFICPTQPHQTVVDPNIQAIAAQVAALNRSLGRGRGRGGANRGRGSGRGGSVTNSGAGASGSRGPPWSAQNPRHKGTRHPDGPPWGACKKHFIWGKSAHWCEEPFTCEWRTFCTPRPAKTQ